MHFELEHSPRLLYGFFEPAVHHLILFLDIDHVVGPFEVFYLACAQYLGRFEVTVQLTEDEVVEQFAHDHVDVLLLVDDYEQDKDEELFEDVPDVTEQGVVE